MKNNSKYINCLLVLIVLACSSCEKFSGGSGESITGAWRCSEEIGTNIRHYSVSIDRAGAGFDTSYYVIYNFHNLGFDFETYVQLKNAIVTIKLTNGEYNVSGNGTVSKDLKTIDWVYSISGLSTNDSYVIAKYNRQ